MTAVIRKTPGRVIRNDLASAMRDTSDKYKGERIVTLLNDTHVLCQNGAVAEVYENICDSLQKGQVKPEQYSMRDLFESLVEDGSEIVRSWDRRNGGSGGVSLIENAVETGAFSNITGQIVYTQIMQKYNDPTFIGDRLCSVVPTSYDGEKIPGMGRVGDAASAIGEGQPYPQVGLSEEWVETPQTTKYGMIVPVTKEAIFFDRTGLILQRAGEIGYWLGLNREKRILDCVFGITNTYKYKGNTISTYGDNSGTHDWDNLAATNALVDYTDIENLMLLFDAITDPMTGELVTINAPQLVVPSALSFTARMILNATSVQRVDNQANSSTIRGTSSNPLPPMDLVTSPLVKARTSSASTWFAGDFKKAFEYRENWPITTVMAPPNSEAEFTNDIVMRYKTSERGAAAVINPRYVAKATG